MSKEISRRRFLFGAGAFAVAVLASPKAVFADDWVSYTPVPLEKELEILERPTLAARGEARSEEIKCENDSWEGEASYYSHAGCMGCSSDQRMANGEIFKENQMTIAFMRVELNTKVLVVNQETGKSVEVRVTDRGHFEYWGRIADLSKGAAEALGFNLKRGLFPVKIIRFKC